MTHTKYCTLCGGAGHALSECPWRTGRAAQRGIVSLASIGLIVLALAVAGDVTLCWLWLKARDKAVAVQAQAKAQLADMTGQRDGARQAATACSDAVEGLRALADKREKDAATARKDAAAQARAHSQIADVVLATPAAVPGDACASAQVRVDGWLKKRAAP